MSAFYAICDPGKPDVIRCTIARSFRLDEILNVLIKTPRTKCWSNFYSFKAPDDVDEYDVRTENGLLCANVAT